MLLDQEHIRGELDAQPVQCQATHPLVCAHIALQLRSRLTLHHSPASQPSSFDAGLTVEEHRAAWKELCCGHITAVPPLQEDLDLLFCTLDRTVHAVETGTIPKADVAASLEVRKRAKGSKNCE